VRITNSASLSLSSSNTTTRTSKLDVEIHTENTGVGIVLDTKINVLLNTKTEVTRIREILLHEFVLLDLKTTLKNLKSLLATNSSVNSNLLITTNRERTNGETS
jgi:hypothetical protein